MSGNLLVIIISAVEVPEMPEELVTAKI